MPIHDPLNESANSGVIRMFQLERLQATLNRVYRHVPFYRSHFDKAGLAAPSLSALEDLRALPFTNRSVLIENRPYGLFAVPLSEIVRLQVASSSPTGEIVVGHTVNDIEHWTELAGRTLACAGVTAEDVVLILLDYDLCSGALGLHMGAEHVGATVVPGSSLAVERQIEIIQAYHVTALVGEPSGILRLAETLEERGLKTGSHTLRRALITGESRGRGLRPEIQKALDIQPHYSYGIPEIMFQGIAAECERMAGLHVNEDHFLVEIVDPKGTEALPDGETGELVVTTLTKEGFPLIRYRTGDLTSIDRQPCACGRTFLRLAPISGRCDDLCVIGGARFYPSEIGTILAEAGHPELRYRIILSHEQHEDHLELRVAITNELFQDEIRKVQFLHDRLQDRLMESLRIPVTVKLVELTSLGSDASIVEDRRWKN